MALLRFADSAARNMSIYSFKPGNVSSDDARNSRSRHAWSQEPSARTHGSLDIAGRLHPLTKLRPRGALATSGRITRRAGETRLVILWPAYAGGRAAGLREAAATRETLRSRRRDQVETRSRLALNLGAPEMRPKRLCDLAATRGRRLLGPAGKEDPASLTGRLRSTSYRRPQASPRRPAPWGRISI